MRGQRRQRQRSSGSAAAAAILLATAGCTCLAVHSDLDAYRCDDGEPCDPARTCVEVAPGAHYCVLRDAGAVPDAGGPADAGVAPSVPVNRLPINGSYQGDIFFSATRVVKFAWEPVGTAGPAPLYELAYDTSPTFTAAVTMTTAGTELTSPPLAVSTMAPVGARFYWHARACAGAPAACSDWSPTWWVNVGRSEHDFNGDGYGDVLLGAATADGAAMDAGAAYVSYGSASGLSAAFLIFGSGDSASDGFGTRLAPAGDVDADGYADAVVSARHDTPLPTIDPGTVYVYHGGPTGLLPDPDVLTGDADEDLFGSWVASAGDVNADGYADIVVGARLNDGGGADSGRLYLYLGGPGQLDVAVDTVIDGTPGQWLGSCVNSAGDANGDGYADVIAGAPHDGTSAANAGAAYLYFGGPGTTLDATPDAFAYGVLSGDQYGNRVATAGDVNGDGFSDYLVAAYGDDSGGPDAGAVSVYFGGPAPGLSAPAGFLPGMGAADGFGIWMGNAGDVDGDGFQDVIVGADLADGVGVDSGAAYLYHGGAGASFDAAPDGTLSGGATGDLFGSAVAAAGDTNGDSFADVIVGAMSRDVPGAPDAGAAYVYLGAPFPMLDPTADTVFLGLGSGDALGAAVGALRPPRLPRRPQDASALLAGGPPRSARRRAGRRRRS